MELSTALWTLVGSGAAIVLFVLYMSWEVEVNDEHFKRKWTLFRPTFFWWSTWWRIGFGFHRECVEWNGERIDPCEIYGVYVMLILDPRHWKLWDRTHMYYDGPHDSLIVGPLQLNWDFIWCKKCTGDDEE